MELERKNRIYANSNHLAYVILDGLLDREKYIQDCIRYGKVNVITNTATVYTDCPVLNKDFSNIVFPDKVGEYGSAVLLSEIFGSKKPIVVGVVPNFENYPYIQNEFQKVDLAKDKDTVITIDKDPANGIVTISIYSDKVNKSNMNISVGSKNKDGKFTLDVQGKAKIDVTDLLNINVEKELLINIRKLDDKEKYTKIKYTRGVGLEIIDEFDNKVILKQEGSIIEIDKIRIGGKNGGETLKDLLKDLIQAIQNMTLNTSQGPTFSPPINNSEFMQVKNRVEQFMEI